MDIIDSIVKKIAVLGESAKHFSGTNLTVEQQLYERSKPKEYLELTLELLKAIGGRRIIEIGCMRQPMLHPIAEMHPRCCNDGHSTYFWGAFAADVTSVDIDRTAVKTAKAACKQFKNIKFVHGDGLKFLDNVTGPIDLLFLDAWDVVSGTEYAENHLLAYLKAKRKMASTNIISVDDTDIGSGGKGRLLIPVLEADGYRVLVKGRQTIALKAGP